MVFRRTLKSSKLFISINTQSLDRGGFNDFWLFDLVEDI